MWKHWLETAAPKWVRGDGVLAREAAVEEARGGRCQMYLEGKSKQDLLKGQIRSPGDGEASRTQIFKIWPEQSERCSCHQPHEGMLQDEVFSDDEEPSFGMVELIHLLDQWRC